MPVNIGDNRIIPDGIACVSERDADRLSRHRLRPGDIVYSRRGDVERRALVRDTENGWLCGTGSLRIRPGSAVCAKWLSHYLGHPEVRGWIVRHAVGATMPNLSTGILSAVPIVVPPGEVQRAIGEVLGAIDEKIEHNRRLVDLCDQLWTCRLSQAWRDWSPATSMMPSGWSQAPLSSLARFINGRNFTKGASGSGRMVVRIVELNNGPGNSTVYNDVDAPSDNVVRAGDLLFAWSGSLIVRRWFRDEAIVNQHIFKVIPKPGVPTWLLHGYLLKLLPRHREIAADKATFMGHIQRRHLDEPVPVPNANTRADLEDRCAGHWRRALAAEEETLLLAQLRETLLPRLMSGQLRARDADAVEETA